MRRQIRTSDEAVSRLVRQQTDTSYRTMLVKLNQLFAKTSAEAKANPNDPSRPYHTGAGQAQFKHCRHGRPSQWREPYRPV